MKGAAKLFVVAAACLGMPGIAGADEATLLFGTSTPPGMHMSVRVFPPYHIDTRLGTPPALVF
jgi:hypothetical protein